jgi:hypothetical protein
MLSGKLAGGKVEGCANGTMRGGRITIAFSGLLRGLRLLLGLKGILVRRIRLGREIHGIELES